MKITIGLPSRGRPAGLLTVLNVFDKLASGNHEITYALIIDDDDYETLEQLVHWDKSGFLPENTMQFIAPREKLINARFNEVIKECPADMYSQACDDSYPITQHWDMVVSGAKSLHAFSWQELNDPDNATYIALSQKWLDAVGHFYPEYFPFWFADTWIAEVHMLAFGKPLSIIRQLQLGGKRGTTQGMRDLEFWFKFYAKTRIERIREAEKIAHAFGFPLNVYADRAKELALMEETDKYQLTQVPRYEVVFKANVGEPSQRYKTARYKAEIWSE